MKKYRIALLLSLISAGLFLTSCHTIPSFDEITTAENTSEETTSVASQENQNNNLYQGEPQLPGEPVDPNPSSSDTEETTNQNGNSVPSIDGELVGYTSKGYPITVKNGITYIDGVLVANKTYALPASYNPGDLLSECASAFSQMKDAASSNGLSIWNASGFRSYELQSSLYTRYSNRDGKEAADRYSARPGHSEHQTGLAIDLNEITSSFANTAEGKWVEENCWRYGFILRYPKDKEAQTGYMYEPWHIRYVGVEVAEKIYNSGLCLEEYFGITSVYGDTSVPAVQETPSTEAPEPTVITEPEEITTVITVG